MLQASWMVWTSLTVFFSVVIDPGCSSRGVPCGCRQAQMPGIMAVMDQKDTYAVGFLSRMHVLRQKGRRRKKKKKKRRKKRLLRSLPPRPVSGCCLRSTPSRLLRTAWFYSGYKFLHRSRRLFGTNSTQLLRDGGARAVRTWKPGLSTSHWYLTPTCSVPVTLEEHRKFGVFWETTSRYFYDPLYLTVTCSDFARGV